MPFHRFEGLKSYRFNPHLSTAEGPVIEGEFMYFRRVTKRAGTGSELHYHPNELMAFPLEGKINCVVGADRRIVPPGTFVHIPPYARHGFKATEDGDLHYLYIKDRTWTLIGAAADEALPDKALSANKVAEEKRSLHEIFLYVIRGAMEADVGGEKRRVAAGDVIQVPRGAAYRWTVRKGEPARYAAVRSTPRLEAAIRKHGAADNWRG